MATTSLHFDLLREQSKWVTFLSMFIHSVNSQNGSHSSPYLSTPWPVKMAHIHLYIYPLRVQSKWLIFLSTYSSTPWTVEMAHIPLYIHPLREQSKWLIFLSIFIHSVNSWNGSHSSLYLSTTWTVEMAHILLLMYFLHGQTNIFYNHLFLEH